MENFIFDLNFVKGINQSSILPISIHNFLTNEIIKYICEEENKLNIEFFYDVNLNSFKRKNI